VSERAYHPARGDLIELNFQPAAGREIDKRRPAIVLTPVEYNRRTGICLAVPVSTRMSQGPFWIEMPDGYLDHPSMILCDYMKSFDYRERSARLITKVPEELVDEIVNRLLDLIDPVR
jgi:mRNA interferase MazF